ncbi:MAG: polymer-forming cytoskeletal protein [Bacteroidia bacterium]
MALGKVESIDTVDPTAGTVKEDETEQVYPFSDANFPTSGLKVGDPCTYEIDYSSRIPTATNLKAYAPTTKDITTTVQGPLTVNVGETLNVKKGGMVNGAITINNGNLFVEDTGGVVGEVTVNSQGSFIVRKGGMVNGNIMINQGSACKVVNKGTVKGNIMINSANRFIVGNDNGGGTITGSITVDKIRKVTITATSVINCGA